MDIAIVFYGMKLLNPNTFVVSIFLISSVVSFLLGTSLSSAFTGIFEGTNMLQSFEEIVNKSSSRTGNFFTTIIAMLHIEKDVVSTSEIIAHSVNTNPVVIRK